MDFGGNINMMKTEIKFIKSVQMVNGINIMKKNI